MNARNPSRRSDDAEVVTLGLIRKYALKSVLTFGGLILFATWRLASQTKGLIDKVDDARASIPHIESRIDTTNAKIDAVTEQMRRTNKILDSVLTLMAERERRSPPASPLLGRE